ncbi:metal ABC transporter ATP-binding protein [Donghicola sp. C2-DW-16]|uniref:Metal ABC transporter ATP-binding protein n=1 Tax=Donghicola mangrovi TaxID=2729614 RepID=A0A850Q4J8_9RHOB|nr:metal ABC transporter ATP-binding protein [Donghicola mangrovi]NVO21988.1 metal ABC transporter ATP-binding protein [Donghicola mangrovi]NVO26421.1 metal ABC transporter ATP-binding protein [Donghicola mangrovi]
MLITAEDMSVTHGAAAVLRDVNFQIEKGEIVTVIGPNGSGKSTLIRALLGVLPPSSGRIRRAKGLRIGYVPQKLSIDASLPMTVRRFLSLPVRISDDVALQALTRTGVEGLADRQMVDLSGGQFQRVLLARALLSRPDILILDEPTQGLDHPGINAFYELIEQVRQEIGCAVLLVSHDLHVVMRASDRVICLNGHICCQGTPSVVRNAPEYQALFGVSDSSALAIYEHHHDHIHDENGCCHD